MQTLMAFGSDTIPRERFTSPEFLALEYERLWPHVWQIACRVEEVAGPGDFVEYSIGAHSVFVVRGGDGRLRGFLNTCPHRGTRLAEGYGTFGAGIRCLFHGWGWDLQGANTFVLDRHEFRGDDGEQTVLRSRRDHGIRHPSHTNGSAGHPTRGKEEYMA